MRRQICVTHLNLCHFAMALETLSLVEALKKLLRHWSPGPNHLPADMPFISLAASGQEGGDVSSAKVVMALLEHSYNVHSVASMLWGDLTHPSAVLGAGWLTSKFIFSNNHATDVHNSAISLSLVAGTSWDSLADHCRSSVMIKEIFREFATKYIDLVIWPSMFPDNNHVDVL